MKFTVKSALTSGGRIGQISQLGRGGNVSLETPLCTLFTKGGSAPYLSKSMLNKIDRVPQMATVSINALAEHYENVKELGQSLGEFTAMKERILFTTLHDSSVAVPPGKNGKAGTAVWSKRGKTLIDPVLYMKIQEAFLPDWFQALSDGATDDTCARKRLTKSVDRTLDFLDEIIEIWKKSETLKNSSLIGVIEGGFNEDERKRSALETMARPVHGFLIEGFQKAPVGNDIFENQAFLPILSKTISFLPEDKPRMMEVAWSPLQVIKAFKQGVDIFSSSYPHTLTEKGVALVLDFTLPAASSTAKLNIEVEPATSESEKEMCIDLNDKRYFEDFSPLLEGCGCYTCATFSRSYIHHLLNTSELLGNILLTIHNFQRYFEFFDVMREAARTDRLTELEQLIRKSADA